MFRKKDMRSLLLVTQGDHGIDAHRAPAGNVAGEERDSDQRERDGHEGQRISRSHAVQERSQITRHADRCRDTDDRAQDSESESLSKDEPEYFATLRSQSSADANL